ncbi:MAG: hypothetical protein H6667_20040 [Ardenticatenaceae bacterium]|nr:hypothetical protein [Ardenticatenaceae bacterium]MCB9443941.1 hypothetical protein [Ardenticatenaceae bacterium]
MSTHQSQVPVHKRPLHVQERPPLVAPGDLQFVLAVSFIVGLHALPASVRPRFLMQLSRMLGVAWYRSSMRDVHRVRHHLQTIFPNRWPNATVEQIIRQQLSLTVWNFMTLNLIPTLSQEQSAHLLPVAGTHHLEEARTQDKAVLLLGAHIGPYAYPIAAVLQSQGYKIHEVGHARPRQGSSWLYRKLYWPRIQKTCQHMKVIDPLKGTQNNLLDVIYNKEVLFLLPDQLFILPPDVTRPPQLVPIDYLGYSVNLETGGLRFCKRLETAVFTALPEFVDGRYHITIEPFSLPTTGLKPEDLATDLQQFMDKVAHIIETQPFLWRDLRRSDLLERLYP